MYQTRAEHERETVSKEETRLRLGRGFSPWLGVSKMAPVLLGDWTEQVYEPILRPVSVYRCQLDVAKFRCNNGSLFSGTGSERPAPSRAERDRKRERGRERSGWDDSGHENEEDEEEEAGLPTAARSLTDREGKGILLQATTLFVLARNHRTRGTHTKPVRARTAPGKGEGIRSSCPSSVIFLDLCSQPMYEREKDLSPRNT